MSANVLELSDASFQQEVAQSALPAVVDFWAEWCGPCKLLSPIVEQLAGEFTGKIKFGKVNVDDHIEQAQRLRVMNIPTLIFFKGGQEVDRVVGVAPKEALVKKLNALLG
ncbi:MAG: thioredoxin [Candidatus Omnitrophica bacterium]|nr:thioredoxin [Candidatus Omnitrophota bacterium]